MSGGRFLVSLREVMNSEKIISLKSLLKENIDFQSDDIHSVPPVDNLNEIGMKLNQMENEIMDASLTTDSEEVCMYVSGYVIKKLVKRFKCVECENALVSNDQHSHCDRYIKLLNRGGLVIPGSIFVSFVGKCFSTLDYIHKTLLELSSDTLRKSAEVFVDNYVPPLDLGCPKHHELCRRWTIRTVVNIFFNNDTKISNGLVRGDAVKQFKARHFKKI